MFAQPQVKVIGVNGQISLGKQYAGQQVLVEEQEIGVWLIRTADVIPHNERWLHDPAHKMKLESAMAWAVEHTASDNGTDDVLQHLGEQTDNAE